MHIVPDAFFSALSGTIRLRCLLLLRQFGELCVCELTQALGEPQPKVSRHLGHLREAGLVQDRRSGLWVHYRLHPHLPEWAVEVLAATIDGVGDQAPFSTDRRALADRPVQSVPTATENPITNP